MLPLLTMLAAGSVASTDIRPLLRQQGFAGPINGSEVIKYVGQIDQGRKHYRVYFYRGSFRPVPAGVMHGVNRVIVIEGSTFVGSYDASLATDCTVRGHKVICNTASPGVIDFTEGGPPPRILFDGAVEEIAYGDKLSKK
jgi:hypothetical protein